MKKIVYDRLDAPMTNIYDVVGSQSTDEEYREKVDPNIISVPAVIPASPGEITQTYTLHFITDEIEEGFETKDMTISELRKELSRRNLSTQGITSS